MKILSLGLSGASDEIRLNLEQDCPGLAQDGLRVVVEETNRGKYTFLGWNITEGELSFRNYERVKNVLKNYVAQMLADTIVLQEEKFLLRKIINQNYRYFGEEERGIIYNNALEMVDSNFSLSGDFNFPARRNEILVRIREYFDNHHELVLDGFIHFRLKDYRKKLTAIVDRAVDEYMMDLEYKEFIRVLRYFVDVQEAQMEEVHVIIGDGDSFKIRDSRGRVINNQYLETFMVKNTDGINYEDLLISALITIAPQNVMLHYAPGAENEGVINTVQRVFEGRVIKCNGCDLCQSDQMGWLPPP